jgi:hypothetical protein
MKNMKDGNQQQIALNDIKALLKVFKSGESL